MEGRSQGPGSGAGARGGDRRARLTGILSKRPAPGRVKTRLVPPLTPDAAARLAEGMLADAVERCSACSAFRTALVFAPPEERAWFAARFPELDDLRAQEGDGLGARLARFFERALAEPGTRTVVAIGSDQPLVGTRTIARAHERLEAGQDLVLGPDAGGGYYLVGLRRAEPALFTEVAMSSAGMCEATLALARGRGLRAELLEPGYDVDVAADLERLRADLGRLPPATPEFPRHTALRLRELFPPPS